MTSEKNSSKGLSQDDLDASYEFLEHDDASTPSRVEQNNSDEEDKCSTCSSARHKYITKKLRDMGARCKASGLIGMFHFQSMLQDFEEVEMKSTNRNACSASSIDESTDKNAATTQTSATETQSVGTETESVPVEHQTVSHQDRYKKCMETETQSVSVPTGNLSNTASESKNCLTAEAEKSSSDRCSMQWNIDDYMENVEELKNCFLSTRARYTEIKNIFEEFANVINRIRSSKSNDNRPLTENNLTELKKILTNYSERLKSVEYQILWDKHGIINAEKHYQKILLNYRLLVLNFNSAQLENEKVNKCLKKQLELREQECKALKKQNACLKTGFDMIQMDLNYFLRQDP